MNRTVSRSTATLVLAAICDTAIARENESGNRAAAIADKAVNPDAVTVCLPFPGKPGSPLS